MHLSRNEPLIGPCTRFHQRLRKGLPVHQTLHLVQRVVRNPVAGIGDDELMTRAAALAFYSALSFALLLVLLLWLVSSLRPEWQQQLLGELLIVSFTVSALIGTAVHGHPIRPRHYAERFRISGPDASREDAATHAGQCRG